MSKKIAIEAAPNWGSFTKAELIRTIKLQDKQKRTLLKQVTRAKELADTLDTALRKERSEVDAACEQARVRIDELRVQCDDTSLVAEALRKERDALRREIVELKRDRELLRSEVEHLRHEIARRNHAPAPKVYVPVRDAPALDAADKRFIDAHMPEQVDEAPLLASGKRPWD